MKTLKEYLKFSPIYGHILHKAALNAQLYEGLITSYPLKDLLIAIKKNVTRKCKYKVDVKSEQVFSIGLKYPFEAELLTSTQQILNTYGWFVALATIFYKDGNSVDFKSLDMDHLPLENNISYIRLICEAKYSLLADVEQISQQTNILYHATEKKYVKRIMKQGLTPRSNNKMTYHPERIYLTTSIEATKIFTERVDSITNKIHDWVILQVRLQPFLYNSNMRLYKDPAFDGAYFTLNSISRLDISITK